MAVFVNINEKQPHYDFLNICCIGRRCFHGVIYEGGKSMCSNRRHHGCPDPLPSYNAQTADKNQARGWRFLYEPNS